MIQILLHLIIEKYPFFNFQRHEWNVDTILGYLAPCKQEGNASAKGFTDTLL